MYDINKVFLSGTVKSISLHKTKSGVLALNLLLTSVGKYTDDIACSCYGILAVKTHEVLQVGQKITLSGRLMTISKEPKTTVLRVIIDQVANTIITPELGHQDHE